MEERRRSPQAPRLTGSVQISEPELDMCRQRPVETSTLARVRNMLHTLILGSRSIVLPMRSIGREIEESWPTGEG
ncbi:MAG TPA: hypothetical protein VGY99_32000 [Candidatus Binataceae bacterium]|jgi:hypothetical protein|nr:hypothetical protein [Candidatus Binataceae bacterium]